MKKCLVIVAIVAILGFAGCGEAPKATLEPEGVENIITENVITENTVKEIQIEEISVKPIEVKEIVTTWDNVPTKTW